jgi:DNA replication protein DnaD
MALAKLGSENSLQMCKEIYGMIKSMTLIIIKEFCATIKKHLKPLMILKLIKNKIKEINIGMKAYTKCSSFKGEKDGLSRYKIHWNFI